MPLRRINIPCNIHRFLCGILEGECISILIRSVPHCLLPKAPARARPPGNFRVPKEIRGDAHITSSESLYFTIASPLSLSLCIHYYVIHATPLPRRVRVVNNRTLYKVLPFGPLSLRRDFVRLRSLSFVCARWISQSQ